MIDYLLASTNTDVKKIGVSGISYGGGLSLLSAASDSRIKAAIAMSCWTNMTESFLQDDVTIHSKAIEGLQRTGKYLGTLSPDVDTFFNDYLARANIPFLVDMTKRASAIYQLAGLNANKPAIFMANAYSDGLFTPNQFETFFNGLSDSVPKHIEFAPGVHAGPELSGLLPLYTNYSQKIFTYSGDVWGRAYAWADAYIKDYDNTVKSGTEVLPPIILDRLGSDNTLESYNSFSAISTDSTRLHLEGRGKLMPYDPHAIRKGTLAKLTTGQGVNVKGSLHSAGIEARFDRDRVYVMRELNETYGALFLTTQWDDLNDRKLRGSVSLNLELESTTTLGLVVAYALDCDRLGFLCKLVTYAPYTYSPQSSRRST